MMRAIALCSLAVVTATPAMADLAELLPEPLRPCAERHASESDYLLALYDRGWRPLARQVETRMANQVIAEGMAIEYLPDGIPNAWQLTRVILEESAPSDEFLMSHVRLERDGQYLVLMTPEPEPDWVIVDCIVAGTNLPGLDMMTERFGFEGNEFPWFTVLHYFEERANDSGFLAISGVRLTVPPENVPGLSATAIVNISGNFQGLP